MLAGSIKKYKKPRLVASSYPGRDPRIARAFQKTNLGKRQFPILLFGVLTLGFLAINGALNASTGASNTEKDSSFLRWILRNEGQAVQAPTPKPIRQGSFVPAPTPKSTIVTKLTSAKPKPIKMASFSVSGPNSLKSPDSSPLRTKRQQAKLNNRVVIERVRKRDTLSSLLQRQRVPLSTVYALARGAKPVFNLAASFQPGKLVKLVFNSDKKLIAIAYPVDKKRTMTVIKKNDGEFSAQLDNNLDSLPKTTSQLARASFDSTVKDVFTQAEKLMRVEIKRGDYLTGVLARRHISRSTAVRLAKATKPVFDLARYLKPGNELKLALSKNGDLQGLSYPLDSERTLWVTREEGKQFVAQIEKKEYEIRLETITGLVRGDGSLFLAGKHAGLTKIMAVKLAALFEWDVDFARDIRTGDRFTVIREGKYYEGSRVRDGAIVAAEFVNQGHKYRAVKYINPEGKSGYFDTKGRSMRKMFIRAPVDFSRISSQFAKRRKHPVLGFTRAHKGTDFAASTGTPVRSAGNGRVIFSGRKGGFGNVVMVRHNGKYTTAYAHLYRISKKIKKNSRVKQGQVIGQVGMTGTATGPHLHYEIRVNGRQVDPLNIQLPAANPVPRKYMADFRLKTASLLARLNSGTMKLASLTITR
jgi:murein DD-endopeptidase MepM/ murein hydrolase activator NlpD